MYKVVMAKTTIMMAFAEQYSNWASSIPTGEKKTITNKQLFLIAQSLTVNKRPGSKGILNLIIKTTIKEAPKIFEVVLSKCLDEGILPNRRKWQILIYVPKAGKTPGNPSAYRPIYLLTTASKMLVRIVLNRVVKYTEGLSNNQFGMRKSKSRVVVILTITKIAEVA